MLSGQLSIPIETTMRSTIETYIKMVKSAATDNKGEQRMEGSLDNSGVTGR